jgi:hypothetical protein
MNRITTRSCIITATCFAAAAGPYAHALDSFERDSSEYPLDISPATYAQTPQATEAPPTPQAGASDSASDTAPTSTPAKLDYGSAGSRWWSVGAGVAHNFDKATDANAFVGYSYFLDQDIEFNAELGFWYSSQPGKDAGAINPNMVFRWHFINTGAWTVYADAGIGLIFSTDNIPEDGTSFNFTPRAGIGFTRRLTDDGLRLQVGLRWHHLSNARIEGEKNNPGRDSAMLYAGIIFPF